MSFPRFADIDYATPTAESLAAAHAQIAEKLDAGDFDDALAQWDHQRRVLDGWSALTYLRFAQDTADPVRRAAREYADALAPVATGHEVAIKRRLLAGDRAALAQRAGAHAVRLWECDVTTFDPAIAADLEQEALLAARYTELMASARVTVQGSETNLSGLAPFAEHPDRAVRHQAEAARWAWFAEHGAELDRLYDELVRLRHGMARKLGYDNYLALGYRRMRRVDYGPAEVAAYRAEIERLVTPLVARMMAARGRENGWDTLYFWDEALVDPAGNPRPAGNHDQLVEWARGMFDAIAAPLGEFYGQMCDQGFLDLKNRPEKAGGGFCTSFPDRGVPFVFANFNGTAADIDVFTHEMGHAFQNWESRHQPGIDYLWPGMEAAEIHSMGLEFLAYPHIGALVGEAEAARYRRMHLTKSLAFLPYGACIDHFQHEVYEHPDATPAERHAMWQRLEKRYLPWANYGDLKYPAMGGRWQAKSHIYASPLYYIDYTLALCCAMQLWERAEHDPQGARQAYIQLCAMGGSRPFLDLVKAAGLVSPFQAGALGKVVGKAEGQGLCPWTPLGP